MTVLSPEPRGGCRPVGGFDAGDRCDAEVGVARLYSSEGRLRSLSTPFGPYGSYGNSTECYVER